MPEPFETFHAALRDWTYKAWDSMSEAIAEVRRNPNRLRTRGGEVIGGWSQLPEYIWPDRIEQPLLFLPEWKAVGSALRSDPRLHRHFSDGVGSALGTQAITPNVIAFFNGAL